MAEKKPGIEFGIKGDTTIEARLVASLTTGGTISLPIVVGSRTHEREVFVDSIKREKVVKGLHVLTVTGHFPANGRSSWVEIPYPPRGKCWLWGSFSLWFNRTNRNGIIKIKNYSIRAPY